MKSLKSKDNSVREPQRIVILVIGASHRDPGPINLLRQHIAPLHKRDIELVNCTELPRDQSLQQKQQLDNLNFSFCKLALESELLKKLLHHDADHARPYFLASQQDEIIAVLPTVIKKIFLPEVAASLLPNIRQISTYLLNHLAVEESRKLDNDLRHSPYQGLEQASKIHTEINEKVHTRPGFFESVEDSRMEQMSDIILRDAINKTQGRAAIISCQVGALHAQRLAATLKHRIENQHPAREIIVLPMYCYSNYCADIVDGMVDTILQSQQRDAAHIFEQYQKFATPLISISENKDNKTFSSQEFDQVMSLAVAHLSADKVYLDPEVHARASVMLAENDIGVLPSSCPKICSRCTIL